MSYNTPAKTVKTRILLISDTHFLSRKQPDLTRKDRPFHSPLPDADILIHSGDLTSTGIYSEHKLAVAFLRSHPAELKLVIAGNHDVTLDAPFYLKEKPHMAGDEYPEDVNSIKSLYVSRDAVNCGIRYMEEGVETLELRNGVRFTVYASAYTPAFCDWGFAYERDEDRFNLPATQSGIPSFPRVDIMITHGPPQGVRDQVVGTGMYVGCAHLWKAVQRAKPQLHVFGHIHEGWGAERWVWNRHSEVGVGHQTGGTRVKTWDYDVLDEEEGRWTAEKGRFVDLSSTGKKEDRIVHGESTIFVNASIMDVSYKPVNAPWVLDMDLPVSNGGA